MRYPPRYSPDLCALRLLVPDAPDEVSLIPNSGSFSIPKLLASPAAAARMHFLSGSRGGRAAGLRLSSFSCASTARNALLFALRERIAEHPVLVTFNGKSFDWPLLETRYRMSRKISVPTLRAHLDFLHPARSLWRLRLGSVRLSELERHVLGWDRGEDVLSGHIPQIYSDYVRGGPPERLVPVFHHNQMDLRGLAALSRRILSLLGDAENWGKTGWNCLACPASAKSEESTREPGRFMRSRLPRFCRPKQIGQHGGRWQS